MGKTKSQIQREQLAKQEAVLTPLAFAKAMAWAQSVKGTPYGSTTPTLSKETNR